MCRDHTIALGKKAKKRGLGRGELPIKGDLHKLWDHEPSAH